LGRKTPQSITAGGRGSPGKMHQEGKAESDHFMIWGADKSRSGMSRKTSWTKSWCEYGEGRLSTEGSEKAVSARRMPKRRLIPLLIVFGSSSVLPRRGEEGGA